MGAEYAGHSAACCMLARAIDGVSRVCCVFCIVLSCVRVGVVRCGLVTPASYETLVICCPYISYVQSIQKLYISRFPRRIGSCGRRNIDTKRHKNKKTIQYMCCVSNRTVAAVRPLEPTLASPSPPTGATQLLPLAACTPTLHNVILNASPVDMMVLGRRTHRVQPRGGHAVLTVPAHR